MGDLPDPSVLLVAFFVCWALSLGARLLLIRMTCD